MPTPTGSISFVFTYVFAEKCAHQRLAPPQRVSAPPTGNPGSATGTLATATNEDAVSDTEVLNSSALVKCPNTDVYSTVLCGQ